VLIRRRFVDADSPGAPFPDILFVAYSTTPTTTSYPLQHARFNEHRATGLSLWLVTPFIHRPVTSQEPSPDHAFRFAAVFFSFEMPDQRCQVKTFFIHELLTPSC